MTTITIRLPGAVWCDYLDPNATAMETELGLADLDHRTVRRGYGMQKVYESVPVDMARELADYLDDRADLLLANDDEDGSTHRRAMKTAQQIRQQITAAA